MQVSAAHIRSAKEARFDERKDPTAVPPGMLAELQIHEIFKKVRNDSAVSTAELAAFYQIDERKIKTILKTARLPRFVKDPVEDLTVAV